MIQNRGKKKAAVKHHNRIGSSQGEQTRNFTLEGDLADDPSLNALQTV